MAYDIGGRGDKSFNDSAAAGLDQAQKDLCVGVKELSAVPNETDAQKAARLTLLATAGYNPIIAVGFAYALRGAGGGKSGSAAAQGDLFTEDKKPDQS
jgi:basic membrane protein A and related proteins